MKTTTRWKTRTKRVVLINSERYFFERLNLIITVCFTWYLMRRTRYKYSGEAATSATWSVALISLSEGNNFDHMEAHARELRCGGQREAANRANDVYCKMWFSYFALSLCLYYHHISLNSPEKRWLYLSIPQIISQSKKNSLLSEKICISSRLSSILRVFLKL